LIVIIIFDKKINKYTYFIKIVIAEIQWKQIR